MNLILPDRVNLSKEIVSRIKDLILHNQLKSGDKLPSEADLCNMLKISRPTIREAVKILIAENIVEIRRGKGTFVTSQPGMVHDPLGVSFMNQKNILFNLFETRLIIEPNIAYLAAQRVTDENIQKMGSIIKNIDAIHEVSQNHSEIDIQFHSAIAEATQNDILYRIVPIINDSIYQGYLETINVPGSFEKAVIIHERIFEAIKHRNPDLAKAEMKKHLEEVMKDIFEK